MDDCTDANAHQNVEKNLPEGLHYLIFGKNRPIHRRQYRCV